MSMLLRRHYPKKKQVSEEAGNLQDKTVKELKALAKSKGVEGYSSLDKESLIAVLKET